MGEDRSPWLRHCKHFPNQNRKLYLEIFFVFSNCVLYFFLLKLTCTRSSFPIFSWFRLHFLFIGISPIQLRYLKLHFVLFCWWYLVSWKCRPINQKTSKVIYETWYSQIYLHYSNSLSSGDVFVSGTRGFWFKFRDGQAEFSVPTTRHRCDVFSKGTVLPQVQYCGSQTCSLTCQTRSPSREIVSARA